MMKKIFIFNLILFAWVCTSQSQISSDSAIGFKKISYKEFNEEAMKLIGDDWMLITAGDTEQFNMMTASWGGLGWLWNKPVAFIFVRPQRYTFEFIEKENYFTLTFFEEKFRDTLLLLGTKSGRDMNKMKDSGLMPFETENKSIAYKEAKIVMECKKVYASLMESGNFTDTTIVKKVYPDKDFHKMFVGEIVNIWVR